MSETLITGPSSNQAEPGEMISVQVIGVGYVSFHRSLWAEGHHHQAILDEIALKIDEKWEAMRKLQRSFRSDYVDGPKRSVAGSVLAAQLGVNRDEIPF